MNLIVRNGRHDLTKMKCIRKIKKNEFVRSLFTPNTETFATTNSLLSLLKKKFLRNMEID